MDTWVSLSEHCTPQKVHDFACCMLVSKFQMMDDNKDAVTPLCQGRPT